MRTGAGSPRAASPYGAQKGREVAKVKNVGEFEYVSGELHVAPGEVVDVAADKAEYLLSEDCPGKFEAFKDEAPKGKGK